MAKSALHRCSAVKSIVVVLFFYSLLLLHDFSTKLSRTLWPLFRPVCLSFFCLRLLLAWEAYRGQAVRRGYACVCVSLSPFFAFVSPECLAGRVLIISSHFRNTRSTKMTFSRSWVQGHRAAAVEIPWTRWLLNHRRAFYQNLQILITVRPRTD